MKPTLAGAVMIPLLVAACTAGSAPAPPAAGPAAMDGRAESHGPEVLRDLERVRTATAAFRDIAAAHAAGFPTATPACLENQPAGGMGHHYVDRRLLDDALEVERPEILVYAPTSDGKQKLVGVEYIVPYTRRPRNAEPPRIFGQALKRSDELMIWYLHVWAWEENRSGLFADWNPAVKCSPRTGA